MTLNELAIEYKKNKDSQTLNEIFKLLLSKLDAIANNVFYTKKFFGDNEIVLSQTKKTTLKDIKQDLYLFVLELIEKYDVTRPFENYVNTSIYLWKPSCININFLREMKITVSETEFEDEKGNSYLANLVGVDPTSINANNNYEGLFKKLTSQEKMVLNILRKDSSLSQSVVARIIGVNEKRMSKIFLSLRKKYKGKEDD